MASVMQFLTLMVYFCVTVVAANVADTGDQHQTGMQYFQ